MQYISYVMNDFCNSILMNRPIISSVNIYIIGVVAQNDLYSYFLKFPKPWTKKCFF